MASIPLVDLGGNLDPDHALARASARELFTALSTMGFAYLGGHSVPPAVRSAAFMASRDFHTSALEKKQSLAINAFHRGYMALATSTIVTSSVAKVTRPNMSESLMLMHELPPDDPGLLAGKPLQGPNQWPEWLPGFRPPVEAFIEEVDRLARYIIRLIAISLDLPARSLDRFFDKPTSFLRMLHYPPQLVDDGEQFGSAPHTDYGIITVLAQDNSGGLQVRPRGGAEWVDAPPIQNTFVLNVGDMLARWTNDRFVSTPHRVINRSGGDRYSMPYFLDTGMDAQITCLPGCATVDRPAQYPPVRFGDYLMERLNKNHDYRRIPDKAATSTR
jgi:isopenicillin N synthase-like dioxygenase